MVLLLGLATLVGLLLARQYRGSVAQQAATEVSFLDHTRGQAAQLDYFLGRIEYEMGNLSERRVVKAYFQNKALGITMPYGLRVSLVDLAKEMRSQQRATIATGQPLFSRLVLVDAEGMVVHDTNRPDEDPGRPCLQPQTQADQYRIIEDGKGRHTLTLSHPCRVNEKTVGRMVGLVPMTTIWSLFGASADSGEVVTWLQIGGRPIFAESSPHDRVFQSRLLALQPPIDQVLHSHLERGSGDRQELIVAGSRAGQRPIGVYQARPLDDAVSGAAPQQVLLMLILALIAIMVGSGLMAHTKAHALSLEREIRQREVLEHDLREARDRAETANRAKSQFLANMSHEIRTPLNGILGMTELILDTDLDEVQQDFARTALESGESLLHIINDILDISRIDSGKVELESAPLDARELLASIRRSFGASLLDKNITLEVETSASLPALVLGDPMRLRQILVNLIGNAVKFTEKGGVRVTVDYDETAEVAEFHVIDSGVGIPPEKQDAIFHPFTQADNSTTRHYGGTGLGLAISRRLAELMDGRLGLHSVPGQGSDFSLHLSLPRHEDASQETPEAVTA